MDNLTLFLAFRRFQINERRRFGGGRGGFLILSRLMEEDGLTQRQLADSVGIRAQSLSEALLGMEGKGHIFRRPDETDRRVIRVYITEEGKAFFGEHQERLSKRAEEMFGVLRGEEKQTLYDLLQKITTDGEGE